jgi:hypothetical protein
MGKGHADVLKLDRKSKNITQFGWHTFLVSQKGLILNITNRTFAFPHTCTEKCSAVSQAGGVLAVAECGSKLAIAVLDLQGRVKNLVHSEHSIVGACWAFDDAVAFSYFQTKKKVAYVSSGGLTNQSAKTYTTEQLIIAAGAPGSWAPHVEPDVKATVLEGTFPGTKIIVDGHGYLAVQSYDVTVVKGAGDDGYVTMHLTITGVAVAIAVALFVNSYQSRKTSFWE